MPQVNCPSCKAPNEAGTLMCKRCGDIITKKPGPKNKTGAEFDATAGTLHPGCIIVPIVISVLIVLILFFSFRATPCDHNREIIAGAIRKYEKANPSDKLAMLEYDKLSKPDSKGKPFLKEKPVCPYDSNANYEYDGKVVTCTKCSKKKK